MPNFLSNLHPPVGAVKDRRRKGRGLGSGLGKTAGKGQKGQKARTGHHGIPKPGFEGGQTAMSRRLPKRGFTNWRFTKEVSAVNLGDVGARFESGEVTVDALKEKGLIPRSAELVKILGDGQFSKKLTIVAHYFSKSAKDKLEKAGGTARVIEQLPSKEAAPAAQ